MKARPTLAFLAVVMGLLIFRWYSQTGYLHYRWPFPRILALLFRLDGESAEDADIFETLFWCVASSAAILFSICLAVKRIPAVRS